MGSGGGNWAHPEHRVRHHLDVRRARRQEHRVRQPGPTRARPAARRTSSPPAPAPPPAFPRAAPSPRCLAARRARQLILVHEPSVLRPLEPRPFAGQLADRRAARERVGLAQEPGELRYGELGDGVEQLVCGAPR
jgi:hypothetical protein